MVAGTQAEVAKQNLIILMKMSQLQKTEQEGRQSGKLDPYLFLYQWGREKVLAHQTSRYMYM